MKVGQLDSPILINDTWAVCADSGELESAQTSVTISGLNGDVDEEYKLIIRHIASATGLISLKFNNDSGNNYGYQNIRGYDSSYDSYREIAIDRIYLTTSSTYSGRITFLNGTIHAKSGYLRTAIIKSTLSYSDTTLNLIILNGAVWNNTTDNITSMAITSSFGIGSRIILLKKVTNTTGLKTGSLEVQGKVYGVWQKVYEDTLGSAQTSVTISGLDGNTDVMYRLTCRFISGANSNYFGFRPNNDTGANYGYQELVGANTVVSADRDTTMSRIQLGYGGFSTNEIGMFEGIIYVKSGYIRTVIGGLSSLISGATITNIVNIGQSWNNTADNITSLVVFAGQASGLGIWTFLKLEKLNL